MSSKGKNMAEEKSQISGQTKQCPKCSEPIQKSAKKCKHCGADLRNWFVRHPVWTAIIVIIVVPTFISIALSDSSSLSNSVSSGGQGQGGQQSIEIVSIETKVTESNSVWWKYAWVLTLKNNSTRDKSVNAELKWVDAGGFIIDTDQEYSLVIPAGQEKTFNGFALIDTSVAGNVDGIKVEID